MRRAVLVALLTAATASRADAFVRKVNDKSGKPVFWRESCVPVTIYPNHLQESVNLSAAGIVKSVTEAAHAWSTDVVSCPAGGSPSLEIVPTLAPFDAAPPAASYDAKNSVIFRTEHWGKSGKSGPDYDYDPLGLAITTVTSESDGHIVDVDVEINATSPLNVWMDLDPGVTPPRQQGDITHAFDLQNALTHEFGHFIGLDHTCFIPGVTNPDVGTEGKIRPSDDQVHPIPDCDSAPSAIRATVMFNRTEVEETTKRTLSADDINGVCFIYPASRVTAVCALDQASGCDVAHRARPGRGLAIAVLVGAGAIGEAARRRRRWVSGRGRARS